MIIIVVFSTFLFLLFLEKRMKLIIEPFIDTEVERLTTNVVNQAIDEIDDNISSSLLETKNDSLNSIEKFSYNTTYINQLNSEFNKVILQKLKQLERGEVKDDIISDSLGSSKFKHVRNGILCEVSFSSLRGSILFANIGPVIPIRLVFLGGINPDIDIKVKEYGINNILVEIYFVTTIKEQISMPFSSKRKEVVVNQLISADIIHGKIPDYYNGVLKK